MVSFSGMLSFARKIWSNLVGWDGHIFFLAGWAVSQYQVANGEGSLLLKRIRDDNDTMQTRKVRWQAVGKTTFRFCAQSFVPETIYARRYVASQKQKHCPQTIVLGTAGCEVEPPFFKTELWKRHTQLAQCQSGL